MVDALVVVVVVARGDFLLLLLFLLLSLTTFCACCDEPTVDDDFVVVFFDASFAISVVDVDVVATCKSDGKRRRLLVFTVILVVVVVVEDVRLLRGRSILDTAADDAADDGDGGQNAVTPSIFGPTIITVVHNMQKKDEVDIIRTIIEARNDDLVYLEFEFGAE